MASLGRLLLLLPLVLLSFALHGMSAADDDEGARPLKVGGRSEVKDVESNKEVQDLGLFSVEEYNRRLLLLRGGRNGVRLLTFSRVVAAQRQVVSGVKYYLRLEAAEGGQQQRRRTYDAVVVVKPWLSTRTLVSFEPRRDNNQQAQEEDMGGADHVNVRL